MLNDDDAVTSIDQAMQHTDELVHIRHVQAHGRLIQHIQGVRRFLATTRHLVFDLGELSHQLDALCFTATEGG